MPNPWTNGLEEFAKSSEVTDPGDLILARDRQHDLHIGTRLRKYLPTLAELIDRLSIVQQKEIFIHENKLEYKAERALIEHDIDLILSELNAKNGYFLTANAVRAILMIMLTNHHIWVNESRARGGADDQDKLLKLTHSINGVRNEAKNQLAKEVGGRVDLKRDCFAESLIKDYGNWNVF
jgi:hypothetical protein